MAGHSKWAQIKRKKAIVDSKRGKEFTRLSRMISAESKRVSGDADSPSLRAIIEKARGLNMPKDAIERAVAKGISSADALHSLTYELYGPGGAAILIEAITDNTNRTVQELRHLVSKAGYPLSEPGSALWAFEKRYDQTTPTVVVDVDAAAEEALIALLSAIEEHDDVVTTITNANGFLPSDE